MNDPIRLSRFAAWYRERTGIAITLEQAAILYARRERGELVLASPPPRKGDR
jgi:hypothetical protein